MAVLLFGADSLEPSRVEELEQISGMRVVVSESPAVVSGVLDDVHVAVRGVPASTLETAPRLRWYQNWFAGVEHLVDLSVFRDGRAVLTNASGVHAEPMANQFFGMLLSFARNLPFHFAHQRQTEWRRTEMADVFELDGKLLLVVGYGAIGRRIGELGTAFGMQVHGIRRNPEGTGEHPLGELSRWLAQADVVVNVLPLTAETERLFDSARFSECKPGAIFANLGRGRQVDQAALLQALNDGHLGGALLDVTDPEPLPAESPLWSHQRVLITPHTGGWTDRYFDRTWPLFIENVRRFRAGEPLLNTIDVVAGY